MRLIFAGTPEFSRSALQRLHGAGHRIALVLTQPDRAAGRGLKLHASPVKQFALMHEIAVAQPRSLRLDGKYTDDAAAARTAIEAAQADVMVVAAYGLILPQWVLDLPRLGCLNIHASLLPRGRGAAPIQRAIEAGDGETGVTIMQMDAGLDTGDMLLVQSLPITPLDTSGSLHDKLASLGADMIVEALELAGQGRLAPAPQPLAGVTYAHKITKQEAAIDWTQPAPLIARRIRAFDPFPGAASRLSSEVIKLWHSEIDSDISITHKDYGTILSANTGGVRIACGNGVLRVMELQRPGGKRLAAADFLRGFALVPGMRFEA